MHAIMQVANVKSVC